MRKVFGQLLFGVLVLAVVACTGDNDRFVDGELAPYFHRFVEEGSRRGVTVDFESLHVEGFVRDIGESGVVGQCTHTEDAPNAVIIDPALLKTGDDLKIERIIFHELGHCYLQRGHLDEKDQNGECLSIMHSNANICKLRYESERSRYLDELFKT